MKHIINNYQLIACSLHNIAILTIYASLKPAETFAGVYSYVLSENVHGPHMMHRCCSCMYIVATGGGSYTES